MLPITPTPPRKLTGYGRRLIRLAFRPSYSGPTEPITSNSTVISVPPEIQPPKRYSCLPIKCCVGRDGSATLLWHQHSIEDDTYFGILIHANGFAAALVPTYRFRLCVGDLCVGRPCQENVFAWRNALHRKTPQIPHGRAGIRQSVEEEFLPGGAEQCDGQRNLSLRTWEDDGSIDVSAVRAEINF